MLTLGNKANYFQVLTGKCLADAGEVKESSFRHGEELSQEYQEWNGGENHRQDHQNLDSLKPLWWKQNMETILHNPWLLMLIALNSYISKSFKCSNVLFYPSLLTLHKTMPLCHCQIGSYTIGLNFLCHPKPTRTESYRRLNMHEWFQVYAHCSGFWGYSVSYSYLLHGGDKENRQCDEMKQCDKHQEGRHGDKQHLSTSETFSSVYFCVVNQDTDFTFNIF